MKTDPKKAIEEYGKDPVLMPTLIEFSKIMASHAEKIGAKEGKKDADPGGI